MMETPLKWKMRELKDNLCEKSSLEKMEIVLGSILVFGIMAIVLFVFFRSKQIDKDSISNKPYFQKNSYMEEIGYETDLKVSYLYAENGEVNVSVSSLLINLLGELNSYVNLINSVYGNLQEIEYVENAKQTDTLIIPREANGIYTDMRETNSLLREMGIYWDFADDVGIYMWKCNYRYYYAEKESEDIFLVVQYGKYIGEIQIYYKNEKVMGYEVKYYQKCS